MHLDMHIRNLAKDYIGPSLSTETWLSKSADWESWQQKRLNEQIVGLVLLMTSH